MSVSQRVIRNIHFLNYCIDDFSPILTVGSSLANTETPYTFTISLLPAIGIGNVIQTEFPTEIVLSTTPTITGDLCLGGNVDKISTQIIRVETSQVCAANSLFTMIITSAKNPVFILCLAIFYLFNFL